MIYFVSLLQFRGKVSNLKCVMPYSSAGVKEMKNNGLFNSKTANIAPSIFTKLHCDQNHLNYIKEGKKIFFLWLLLFDQINIVIA